MRGQHLGRVRGRVGQVPAAPLGAGVALGGGPDRQAQLRGVAGEGARGGLGAGGCHERGSPPGLVNTSRSSCTGLPPGAHGLGAGGGGGEAVAVDAGPDQHDVLGVDQAGGAGGGDHAPGGVGGRAAGSSRAGDDGQHPARAQHPLAGGVQQPGVPVVLAAGRAAAGAAAAGDGQRGLPGDRVAGGGHEGRAAGPQPGGRVRNGQRVPAAAAGDEDEDVPPGGCRGLGDRRRAAARGGDQVAGNGERADDPAGGCGGDRAAARRAVPGTAGIGQAGPDAQRHAGACPAGRAARGRRGVRGRAGRLAVPGWVEGLCHGGWSRVPPLTALTLHKSGFRGLFSPARRRNIPAARITGKISPDKFSGLSRRGCGPLPHALYLAFTWDVPAIYLAGAAQVSALMYLAAGGRRAGRRDGSRRAARAQVQARYIAGTRQVHAGPRRPGARYIAGTRQVDRGWLDGASFPSASTAWSFRMDDHSAAPEPFDAADAAFRLLCAGPQPLALHAAEVAAGLPDRPVPLDELRVLLLHPSTSARARNAVWAELVRRARAGDPAWTVGLAGIAMPGLRRAAGSLAAAYRGDPADLQAEVLTGFLAAVRALDLDDLEAVPLASRLCWAAWRAGQQHACAEAGHAARRQDLSGWRDGPDLPWGHPDFVLAAAVRKGILTRAQAGAHRPEPARRHPAVADRRRDRDQPFRPVQPAEKG